MDVALFLKTVIPLFFAILFLQSGLDKVFDWKGNVKFHEEHFANSPLKSFFRLNLGFIAFLEVCCGLLCAGGAIMVLLKDDSSFVLAGLMLAAVIFTMLFFGQRISKDYKGAATIVVYFILDIISILVIGCILTM